MRAISFAAGLALAVTAAVGAYETAVPPRDTICRPGFAAAGRPSPPAWQRLKQARMAMDGIPWALRYDYELDHIVPRCLDGANSLDNLQLQLWPEARVKDRREAEVCRAYCASRIELDAARAMFRRD